MRAYIFFNFLWNWGVRKPTSLPISGKNLLSQPLFFWPPSPTFDMSKCQSFSPSATAFALWRNKERKKCYSGPLLGSKLAFIIMFNLKKLHIRYSNKNRLLSKARRVSNTRPILVSLGSTVTEYTTLEKRNSYWKKKRTKKKKRLQNFIFASSSASLSALLCRCRIWLKFQEFFLLLSFFAHHPLFSCIFLPPVARVKSSRNKLFVLLLQEKQG